MGVLGRSWTRAGGTTAGRAMGWALVLVLLATGLVAGGVAGVVPARASQPPDLPLTIGAGGAVSTFAGSGVRQDVDGVGVGASFGPMGGVVVVGGFFYVMTEVAIRKVNLTTGQVTTLAGGGYFCVDSNNPADVRFSAVPSDMTTDGTFLYVADEACGIRKVSLATGATSTLDPNVRRQTHGIAMGPDGQLYFTWANLGPFVTLARMDPNSGVVTPLLDFPGYGSSLAADATYLWMTVGVPVGDSATIHRIAFSDLSDWAFVSGDSATMGGALTSAGPYLYLAAGHFSSMVRRFTKTDAAAGVDVAGLGLTTGYADGVGTTALFGGVSDRISGMASDGSALWIADRGNNRVRRIGSSVAVAGLGSPAAAGMEADPVNAASGNLTRSETDLSFGSVFGLDWSRTYNSLDGLAGPMGPGWVLAAATSVGVQGDGSVMLRDTDGRIIRFAPDGSGGYVSPEAFYGTLVKNPDSSFTITYFSGETASFDTGGRLVSRQSSWGETVALGYSGPSLVTLTSSVGPSLALSYTSGLLTGVAGSDGRQVSYGYTGSGVLSAMTDTAGGVTTYTTDWLGRIIRIDDPLGRLVVANTYDSAGRVATQVAPTGRTVTFTYNPSGETVALDQATGLSTKYLSDPLGHALRITDTTGASISKTYDTQGNLTGFVDRRASVASEGYDSHGNVLTRTLPAGGTETFAYDSSDRAVAHTDSLGAVTGYAYPATSRVPSTITDAMGGVSLVDVAGGLVTKVTDPDGVASSFAYDSQRNLVSVTDVVGAVTSYGYDAAGRRVRETDPLGQSTFTAYDPAGRRLAVTDTLGAVSTWAYDSSGRLVRQTDPVGAATAYGYDLAGQMVSMTDPLGAATAYGYDSYGNQTTVTRPGGVVSRSKVDSLGRLLSATDTVGSVTGYGYDPDGNQTTVVDPLGKVSSSTPDPLGRVVAQTDLLGRVTRTGYDLAGRTTAITDAIGGVSTSTYDPLGRLTQEKDPAGGVSTTTYTPGGRTAKTTDPAGGVSTYGYDSAGRMVTSSVPSGGITRLDYDLAGRVVTTTSPAGLKTLNSYDPAGRVIAVTDATGAVTRTGYDQMGRVVGVTDTMGAAQQFAFDGDGRMTTATDPKGGLTRFFYDVRGNLTQTIDAIGGSWRTDYDQADRPIKTIDPLGRTVIYAYDSLGRQKAMTDTAGVKETDTYDAAGQLTVRTFSDGSAVRYGYDKLGRRADVTDTVGITRYTFDPAGRVTKVTHPDASVISFAYNPAGQRTQVTYPDLTHADYTYTPNGQISTTVVPGLGTATYVYDPDGRLATETLPGGWSRTYTYTNGLLSGYVENRGAGGTTTSLGRDPAGRITTETVGSKTTRYGYDPAGQLTSITDSAGIVTAYKYDLVGNRLTQTVGAAVTSYRYDLADQLLTTTAGAAVTKFTYDGAGRLLKETGTNTRTYSYDKRGRPQALTVTIGSTTRKTTFTYNPDDLLASVISVSGSTTTTQKLRWDPTSPIPQPLTIQVGTPTTRLVYGNERIAMAATTTSPFSYDAYGSTLTTTATAAFTRTSTYSPFGAPISGTDNGKVRFAYRAELNIEDTLYLRARTYKPTLARFTTKDPINGTPGHVGPNNPYPYAANDPLNMVDPLGLKAATDADFCLFGKPVRGRPDDIRQCSSGTGGVPVVPRGSLGYVPYAQSPFDCRGWRCVLEINPALPVVESAHHCWVEPSWGRCSEAALDAAVLAATAYAAGRAITSRLGPAGASSGSLTIRGSGFSASELRAAQTLSARGYNVVLREATGVGRTSDLLLNGVAYDVYTPTTTSIDRIVSEAASKGSQVQGGGVVIDLTTSPLTEADLASVQARVQGVTSRVSHIIIIK